MKKLKKILAFMLAVVMTLALSGITAFADTTDSTGTITIKNATKEQTYTVYKIFDATYNETTKTTAYSVTAGNIKTAAQQAGSPFTVASTADSNNAYAVTLKDGKSAADVVTWINSNFAKYEDTEDSTKITGYNLTAVATQPTPEQGNTVTFNVPYGYYFITSTLGTIVTVDTNTPNVNVIDKNQAGPEWDGNSKKIVEGNNLISENSANYGDNIKFQIKFKVTNYDGKKEIDSYKIKDTMAPALKLLNDPAMEVKVGTSTLSKDTGYTITTDEDDNSFTLKINWRNEDGTFKYDSPTDITVTYFAKVLDTAVIAGEGNKNIAKLTYYAIDPDDPDNPDDPKPYEDVETSETTTYVYALGFHKVDGADKTKNLSGAEFSVKLGETTIGAVANQDGTYSYTKDNTVDGYTTTFTSDANGLIVIKGLKEGNYTVTETKAPAGYNLLPDSVNIEAVMSDSVVYTKETTTYYDANGNKVNEEVTGGTTVTATYPVPVAELIVENNSGSELPSTGGIGTTIFYVIGGILVVSAGILLVAKRRMRGQL